MIPANHNETCGRCHQQVCYCNYVDGVIIITPGVSGSGGSFSSVAEPSVDPWSGYVPAGWQPSPEYVKSSPDLSSPQPSPTANTLPAVWDLVIRDMLDRDLTGLDRYGVRLQPYNGRDPLIDAYQELLDAAVYIRQAIYERDGK